MSEQHTPGRLTTDEAEHDQPYQNIKLKAGAHHTVATVWIDDAPVHDFNAMQSANARRLVACWDLLVDVPTEEIEAAANYGAAWGKTGLELAALTAQRDELLAALKHIEGVALADEWCDLPEIAKHARAAITKMEGGGV